MTQNKNDGVVFTVVVVVVFISYFLTTMSSSRSDNDTQCVL